MTSLVTLLDLREVESNLLVLLTSSCMCCAVSRLNCRGTGGVETGSQRGCKGVVEVGPDLDGFQSVLRVGNYYSVRCVYGDE